jgi:radical SAM protein with 4Fe4S-binding SPASM domain
MANVLLTERCVRSCPYCFAKEHMDASVSTEMSWDNFIYIADFLEISNEHKVSLLGGEPTLHPLFVDFTTYLLERNFHVNIFTSGILSDEMLDECRQFLSGCPPEKLSFTCNMNHPDISRPGELKKINRFLYDFGRWTSLGFNIYQTDFNIEFIIQSINKYNLSHYVRVGLAHPIPGAKNTYIPLKELKKMAKKFVSCFDLFERFNITPGFDCGFPMCIFSDEELGRLFKLNRGTLNFGCGPAIDIGPDMNVWSCFPLSGSNKKSLYEFNSLQEVDKYYKELHSKIRIEIGGVFDECDSCTHRFNDVCLGGCVAHSIIHFNEEAPVRIKDIYQ